MTLTDVSIKALAVIGLFLAGFSAGERYGIYKDIDIQITTDLLAAANHRCSKNEGARKLKHLGPHNFDVHCNDEALFKSVEIKIEPTPPKIAGAKLP